MNTAVQEGSVLRDGRCHRGGTGHSRRGRGPYSIGERAPRNLMAAAAGWLPTPVAGAPSAGKASEKEAGEELSVGCEIG